MVSLKVFFSVCFTILAVNLVNVSAGKAEEREIHADKETKKATDKAVDGVYYWYDRLITKPTEKLSEQTQELSGHIQDGLKHMSDAVKDSLEHFQKMFSK